MAGVTWKNTDWRTRVSSGNPRPRRNLKTINSKQGKVKKVKIMGRTYKAVEMNGTDGRYQIVDTETNEVLSDAKGFGFKSKTTAYRSYEYYRKYVAQ